MVEPAKAPEPPQPAPAGQTAAPVQQPVAGKQEGRIERDALKQVKEHLTDQLRGRAHRVPGEPDAAQQTTLIKEVAEIHAAIEAIDKTIAGRWSAPSTASLLSAFSVFIAVLAVAINAYVFHLNQDYQQTAKKIDTAISWCTNFYLPSFVSFQSVARELKSPDSSYRLPDQAT